MKRSTFTALVCSAAAAALAFGLHRSVPAAPAQNAKDASADPQEQIAKLQQQVKNLEGLVPDQAAVMSHVGYHFANLWVAIDQQNWPLADFYLGETRNNVKWAVRAKPVRKDPGGNDLAGLASTLKAACGAGGTLKDGLIEIQGDRREAAEKALQKIGHKTRRR